MVRVAGRYGIIGALVLFTTLVGLFYLGRHPMLIPPFFDLRLFLFALFLVFAMREFKASANGILHFWQGLSIGIVCYVMIAFVTSLLIWLWSGVFDPSFVSEYISLSTQNLVNNKEAIVQSLGLEKFNSAIENLPSTTVSDLAFDYFLKIMPFGFIFKLIISILLRKT